MNSIPCGMSNGNKNVFIPLGGMNSYLLLSVTELSHVLYDYLCQRKNLTLNGNDSFCIYCMFIMFVFYNHNFFFVHHQCANIYIHTKISSITDTCHHYFQSFKEEHKIVMNASMKYSIKIEILKII